MVVKDKIEEYGEAEEVLNLKGSKPTHTDTRRFVFLIKDKKDGVIKDFKDTSQFHEALKERVNGNTKI